MKALLWKDMRINGAVIAYALATSVGLFIALAVINQIVQWRTGCFYKEWPDLFVVAATLSLVLELATAVLLGGCAFASERADRTAEFMAYMPVSRGRIVASKALLALAVFAFIGIWDIGTVFSLERWHNLEEGNSIWKPISVFAAISWCMFGSAWFASSISRSHGLSAAVGILVPIGCAGAMMSLTKLMGWSENWLDRGMPIILAALGTAGFVAGVRYYLWRVEP
jgi:ABC-type transport system involved in multi-copper enzyme maturation permease subunit